MVDANVKIIGELIFFLRLVSEDSEIRRLVTMGEEDFSRHRKLTLERIVGIIINMPKRSLSIEIQEFFDSLGKDLESATKGAFSLQRSKLKPLFFEVWNKWLVNNFYHYYGDDFKLEHPTGSGQMRNLKEIADDLSDRLVKARKSMEPPGSPWWPASGWPARGR